MKIVIVCDFSYPGICGVWTRVYNDAKYLIEQGHEVHVFSSNIVKGSNKISPNYEEVEGIKIHRFNAFKLSENVLLWNFRKDLLKLNPDIVHAHNYRHWCTHKALIYSKKLNKPCFLTTHAPFVSREMRGNFLSLLAWLYDSVYKKELNKFEKVITITRWEVPFLFNLGLEKKRIVHIPNSVPERYFIEKEWSQIESPRVLFLGRIHPIKNLECLISAVEELQDIHVTLVGPWEEEYYIKLRNKITGIGGNHRIKFIGPVYDVGEKIKLFSEHDIFVLPSKREAMPQALIEAMAAGLVVISSKTDGGKEIIKNGDTGYLFEMGDYNELAELLKNFRKDDNVIRNAQNFAKQFKVGDLGGKLLDLYESNLKLS